MIVGAFLRTPGRKAAGACGNHRHQSIPSWAFARTPLRQGQAAASGPAPAHQLRYHKPAAAQGRVDGSGMEELMSGEQNSGTPRTERVIVLVWDGMRPDYVTQDLTPNLCALAASG